MDRGDPEFLERLFEQASALAPEEQEAFLEEACAGDPEAEAELRSLIAAGRSAESFFDSLADAVVSLSPWAEEDPRPAPPETDSPDPLIGRSVRQYRIEEQLGRGGMGIVYLAHDTVLHRPVALKFLPRHVTDNEEAAERFLIEARAAGALDHPNVCTVYEIGESEDGRRFIAMAYCEGETLKQKLARGPLPIEEATDYARQIAAGLEAAHRRDIVHRDIKPGNVIVSPDGLVKVLDFGLAKLADVTLTRTGSTMGTVAYMSPEQTRGKEADHRTDLWSLGVVLYEMLTGERPFKGDSTAVVIHAIQQEEPEPLSALRPEVDAELEGVVNRLLAKDPEERYQSASDVRHALGEPQPLVRLVGSRWRWVGLGAAAAAAGIAIVLASPFRSLLDSDDTLSGEESTPLAELATEPWTLVADFEGTADPTYVNTYRNAVVVRLVQSRVVDPLPPDQIARGLELAELPDTTRLLGSLAREIARRGSIRTVVRGNLDQVGNTYSVVLRLEDAEAGAALWSDQAIARGDDEILQVVQDLADLLRQELGERAADVQATRPIVQVRTQSFQAYEKYAEAQRLLLADGEWRPHRHLLWEAVELDPGFAAAWLELRWRYASHPDTMQFALEQARRHKDRMTEAEGGFLEFIELVDPDARAAALERAVRAEPNNLRWIALLAWFLRYPGAGNQPEKWERAIALVNRAVEISPFGVAERYLRLRPELAIRLGRTDEARRYANDLESELTRRLFLQRAAIRDADWAAAESLGVAPDYAPDAPPELQRGTDPLQWAALQVLRGDIRNVREWIARCREVDLPWRRAQAAAMAAGNRDARPSLPGWRGFWPPVELLLHVVTGTLPVPDDSTCWQFPPHALTCDYGDGTEAMQEALAGDSVATRRALESFVADTFTAPPGMAGMQTIGEHFRRYSDYYPVDIIPDWIRAMIAYREGDWETVVEAGVPILDRVPMGNVLHRWMVADAHEKLGSLQRAAELFEPLATVDFDRDQHIQLAGIPYPFAHFRLARIHTELGDTDRAIQHWTTFLDTFTRPDPEYEWMVEEGRAELERLRGG